MPDIQEIEKKLETLIENFNNISPPLKRGGITGKGVKALLESEQVITLQARADDLRKQSEELSSTIVLPEVFEAKIKRFDRQHEDFLADGDVQKAREIEAEKNQFLQEREKTFSTIRELDSQTQGIDGQIKGFLRPVFFESFQAIKAEVAKQLAMALAFKNMELSEFVTLQAEYQIQLPFSPVNEIRLYPEGPYRRIREMLQDELLPE